MPDPTQPVSSIEPARRVVGTGPDTDGDGLSDDFERNVFRSDPDEDDGDGDGLNDWAEYWLDTKPRDRDTDGDGYEDGEDLAFGDPLRQDAGGAERAAFVKRAREQFEQEGSDRDHDLARDHIEAQRGTKADDADSDDDGLSDMVEMQLKTDPLSPAGSTADLDAARARLNQRRVEEDTLPPKSSSVETDDLDLDASALTGPDAGLVAMAEPTYDESTYDAPSFADDVAASDTMEPYTGGDTVEG
jgi:hypothetical protein